MPPQPQKSSLGPYLIPSIGDLFFVTTLLALFFSSRTGLLGDGDTGYHIRAGEYILRTRSIPKFDIFSYHVPPLPWTAHEWLSEVIMAAVHQCCGLTGVVAFFSLLLATTTWLLFRVLVADGRGIVLAAALNILVFASCQIHWLARPHVFSFLLTIVFQHLLDSFGRGNKDRLYLLPPLMLLWVNLHGGFLGGFLLLAAYLVGGGVQLAAAEPGEKALRLKRVKRLALIALACLSVSLINPRGYQILSFPFKLVADRFMMDHVAEFLSPNFHNWLPFKYLLLLLIAVFAVSRKRLEATDFILFLGFTNMSLYSVRYIPLFSLIMAPVLGRHACELGGECSGSLWQWIRRKGENIARVDATLKGHLWPVAAAVVVMAATWSGQVSHRFDERIKCVAATEFLLREKIPGNMFNNDEFGDYLIYRGYRDYKVFMDGRLDMYGSGKMKQYKKVISFEPGWEEVLEQYRVGWIFFDTDSNLSRYLLNHRGWVLIYSDRVASIFVKDLPQYQRLISRYRLNSLASTKARDDNVDGYLPGHDPVW
jgi:hypothetical protein